MENLSSAARWIFKMGMDEGYAQIYHQINLFTDSFTNSSSSRAQFQATRKRNLRAVVFQKSAKNATGLPRSKPANPCPSQNWSLLPPTLFHKSIHLENSTKSDDLQSGEDYKQGTGLNNILKRSAEATYDHCYENNQLPLTRQNYLTNTSSAHINGVNRLLTSSTISRTCSPLFQHHVVAERKLCEKRFVALVPSLKKMNKASVLVGVVKYLK